jgi:hypothetical protein
MSRANCLAGERGPQFSLQSKEEIGIDAVGVFGVVALVDFRYFGFSGTCGGGLLTRSGERSGADPFADVGESGLLESRDLCRPTMASWADAASE